MSQSKKDLDAEDGVDEANEDDEDEGVEDGPDGRAERVDDDAAAGGGYLCVRVCVLGAVEGRGGGTDGPSALMPELRHSVYITYAVYTYCTRTRCCDIACTVRGAVMWCRIPTRNRLHRALIRASIYTCPPPYP